MRAVGELSRLLASRAQLCLTEATTGLLGTEGLDLQFRPLHPGRDRRAVEEAAEKTPDGKFYVSASDDSVLIPVSKSYDPAIPHLPKTADGKYYLDAATDIRYPVDPDYHLGHVRGEEWAANGKRRSVNTGHANSSSTTATIRRSTASKTPPAISAASSNYPGRQDDRTRS